MNRIMIRVAAVLLPMLAAMAWVPAQAQAKGGSIAGPDYGEDGNYRTPAADGRPGVYFFDLGAYAFKKGDYQHAIDMYKVAASWAYKPAEYNLGLMYFKGQGVPVDRSRGAAWMILAAERNAPLYVKARDVMVTMLTDAQFKQTDKIWNELKPTYGDAVALARAKARWIRAGRERTGSHLGHAGNLQVGGAAPGPAMRSATKGGVGGLTDTTGAMLLGGDSVDGSVAYREFDESNNPYSPIFLKHRIGTVDIGSLKPIEPGATKQGDKKQGVAAQPPPSSSPPGD